MAESAKRLGRTAGCGGGGGGGGHHRPSCALRKGGCSGGRATADSGGAAAVPAAAKVTPGPRQPAPLTADAARGRLDEDVASESGGEPRTATRPSAPVPPGVDAGKDAGAVQALPVRPCPLRIEADDPGMRPASLRGCRLRGRRQRPDRRAGAFGTRTHGPASPRQATRQLLRLRGQQPGKVRAYGAQQAILAEESLPPVLGDRVECSAGIGQAVGNPVAVVVFRAHAHSSGLGGRQVRLYLLNPGDTWDV